MEYIVVIFMLFLILYVISCLCKHIVEGFSIGGVGGHPPPPTCKEIPVSSSNNICIDSCESAFTLDLYYGQNNSVQQLIKIINNPESPELTKIENILTSVDKDNTRKIQLENKRYFGGFYKLNCNNLKHYTVYLQKITTDANVTNLKEIESPWLEHCDKSNILFYTPTTVGTSLVCGITPIKFQIKNKNTNNTTTYKFEFIQPNENGSTSCPCDNVKFHNLKFRQVKSGDTIKEWSDSTSATGGQNFCGQTGDGQYNACGDGWVDKKCPTGKCYYWQGREYNQLCFE